MNTNILSTFPSTPLHYTEQRKKTFDSSRSGTIPFPQQGSIIPSPTSPLLHHPITISTSDISSEKLRGSPSHTLPWRNISFLHKDKSIYRSLICNWSLVSVSLDKQKLRGRKVMLATAIFTQTHNIRKRSKVYSRVSRRFSSCLKI